MDKTEHEADRTSPQQKFAVFKPSTFNFSRALEYKDVSQKMVEEDLIVLEVCITQKYTRKSFMVASINMPLKMAVKKFVKEKYRLKPCISTQVPENMKVYNASEMSVSSSNRYHSNPSLLMRQDTKGSWAVPYHDKRRVSSEADLSMVITEMPTSKAPSIEISVPPEEDEELNEALRQIAIMEDSEHPRSDSRSLSRSESKVSSGSTQIDMSWSDVGSLSEIDDLESVSVGRTLAVSEIEVHVPVPKNVDLPTKAGSISASKKKLSKKKDRKSSGRKEELGSVSRPDTPSWDNYVEPLTDTNLLPMDFESDITFDPAAPRLPMATGLDLAGVHHSVKRLSSIHYEDDLTGQESPKVKAKVKARLTGLSIQPEPINSSSVNRSTSESEPRKSTAKGTKVKRSTSEGTKVKVERSFEKIQRSAKE